VIFVFYDLFYNLCAHKGVTPSKACLDMGLSRSLAAKWKNTRATPSADVIAKIADYFGVSADMLLGKEQKEKAPIKDEDLKFALWGPVEDEITEAELEDVRRYAQFVAERKKKMKEEEDREKLK
jgi:transcriptional regulator with XRE-family HTH domain